MVVKITARLLKYLGFLKTGERKITVAHNCIYCKLVSFMLWATLVNCTLLLSLKHLFVQFCPFTFMTYSICFIFVVVVYKSPKDKLMHTFFERITTPIMHILITPLLKKHCICMLSGLLEIVSLGGIHLQILCSGLLDCMEAFLLSFGEDKGSESDIPGKKSKS